MTNKQFPNIKFPDILQDEKFLRWRFFCDAETDAYWNDLLSEYPEIKKEIALADEYLKKNIFKKNAFRSTDKERLLKRIQQNLHRNSKRKRVNIWMRYAAVACVIVTIGVVSLIIQKQIMQPEEIITGNLLDSEDIQLIVNNKPRSFSQNVTIKIGSDGVAKVHEESEQNANIDIDITQNTINKLIVPYGKRSSLELSDGTKITLNSGSSLEFPSVFTTNSRKVKLRGEMYIEVAHDEKKPFYVETSDFEISVLGTTFNVSAYESQPQSVVLVEGSVNLKSKDNHEIKLLPSQMAVYNGGFEKRNVDLDQYISWKKGYVLLNNVPISKVLNYIERYYNLSFNYDENINLMNETCKGKLYLSENVDNVLNAIALLSSTYYKREGNVLYITNKLN